MGVGHDETGRDVRTLRDPTVRHRTAIVNATNAAGFRPTAAARARNGAATMAPPGAMTPDGGTLPPHPDPRNARRATAPDGAARPRHGVTHRNHHPARGR